MADYDFQVIVIGSGPGGYVAAVRAAQLGLKTACVEKMPTLGGTCLNVGCIPSKALLYSTESFEFIEKQAKDHGIKVKDVSIDLSVMMQRKLAVVKGLTDSVATLFKGNNVTRMEGEARFVDPHTIEVAGKKITSANFIIATGSESIGLPFLPFDEKFIVSSTGALSLPTVPKRMLVIGAGAIGLELASVYRRLGTEIVVIEMLDTVTPLMDSTLCKQLLQSLKKQGMEFFLGAKVTAGKISQNEVTLSVEYEQKPQEFKGDVVLVGIGRRPFTKNLGLETVGITPTPKGFIPVDANFHTSQPHIYAIGDVIDGPMLAHKAHHEGLAAAEIIAGHNTYINYVGIPNIVYTHPEVAAVGLTENEARQAGLDIIIGTSFFRGNARARCSDDIEGLVKVIGEKRSGRLIGMHIIGAHASEMIAEGMIAIDKKATLQEIAAACHPHPTLSEAIMEACAQAK